MQILFCFLSLPSFLTIFFPETVSGYFCFFILFFSSFLFFSLFLFSVSFYVRERLFTFMFHRMEMQFIQTLFPFSSFSDMSTLSIFAPPLTSQVIPPSPRPLKSQQKCGGGKSQKLVHMFQLFCIASDESFNLNSHSLFESFVFLSDRQFFSFSFL